MRMVVLDTGPQHHHNEAAESSCLSAKGGVRETRHWHEWKVGEKRSSFLPGESIMFRHREQHQRRNPRLVAEVPPLRGGPQSVREVGNLRKTQGRTRSFWKLKSIGEARGRPVSSPGPSLAGVCLQPAGLLCTWWGLTNDRQGGTAGNRKALISKAGVFIAPSSKKKRIS